MASIAWHRFTGVGPTDTELTSIKALEFSAIDSVVSMVVNPVVPDGVNTLSRWVTIRPKITIAGGEVVSSIQVWFQNAVDWIKVSRADGYDVANVADEDMSNHSNLIAPTAPTTNYGDAQNKLDIAGTVDTTGYGEGGGIEVPCQYLIFQVDWEEGVDPAGAIDEIVIRTTWVS